MSVCLSVGTAFSESPDADLPTLSFLRKQESILERSTNFSLEKQHGGLFGRPRKQESILERSANFSSEKERADLFGSPRRRESMEEPAQKGGDKA